MTSHSNTRKDYTFIEDLPAIEEVYLGPIALFGSGETTPSGRKIFEALFRIVQDERVAAFHRQSTKPSTKPLNIALLETPAGFELNSFHVVKRISDFICHHLQNYNPQPEIIPARKRGTPFSPDEPRILEPILTADVVFMGPGSPTYAVRQLRESIAWYYLIARHRIGAALALSSAATIAIGAYALPVYEIYKVGEELHWKEGLDLFGAFGLHLVFIPHWNNQDGGEELDTSRCFMGQSRFQTLLEMLPMEITVIGIDEKTGLIVDFKSRQCMVVGKGHVTILKTNEQIEFKQRQTFPLNWLGNFRIPPIEFGLPPDILRRVLETNQQTQTNESQTTSIPQEVLQMVEQREQARKHKDWQSADQLRQKIAEMGWRVSDTPNGPKLDPVHD